MLKRLSLICGLMLLNLGLLACTPSQSASSDHIADANRFECFWIWGNISSAPYLSRAKEVYILQGEIRIDRVSKQSMLIPQSISVLKIPKQKVWLVFRSHHLGWQGHELKQIISRIHQWEKAGNQIQGIQIDFDARTQNLHEYGLFLEQLRKRLPQPYQLSITGLMDWSNMRDKTTLRLFRNNIDELIIQTYQGSTTISNYQAYLSQISKLNLPYKIGIVQNGQWNPKLDFSTDPNFKGYVMFLLRTPNPK